MQGCRQQATRSTGKDSRAVMFAPAASRAVAKERLSSLPRFQAVIDTRHFQIKTGQQRCERIRVISPALFLHRRT
jgi:hypothetical protein